MYRQPENSNRVKSMKSRFEGLNDGSPPNEKFKKSPAHVVNKTVNGRISQRRENNNNDIKKATAVDFNSKRNSNAVTSLKEKNCNIDNVKLNILKQREEKDVKINNNRERSRVMDSNKLEIEKVKRLDFSDINKKELCNVPPLNLTRQLNDPSKKGCIKRTPAFRKDKFNNKSKPSSDDLNFANIVKIFEENDKDNNTCDNHLREEKNMTKICSDSVLKSGATSINMSPKLPLKTSVSLTGRFIIPTTTVNAIKSTEKIVQVQKQKLASSSSLDIESSHSKCAQPASFSPQRPSSPEIATLKVEDKEKISNNYLETTKEIKPLVPAYAQVVKHKKTEPESTDVLTDTLKAALKQPLPTGPPPKKPPRTFAHTPNSKSNLKKESSTPSLSSTSSKNVGDSLFTEKLNEALNKTKTPEPEKKVTKTKSDPKLMLQKLENALLNNKLRSPKFSRKNKNTDNSNSTSSSNSNLKALPQTQPNIYTSDSPQKNIFPNCLPSLNCAYSKNTSTNSYTKVPSPQMGNNVSMSTFFTDCNHRKSQEPIYAEPFQYQVEEDSGNPGKIVVKELSPGRTDTLSSSVHYMSNPVCEWNASGSEPAVQNNPTSSETTKELFDGDNIVVKSVSNSNGSENGTLTRHKLNLIMNHTYASPSPTDSDIDSIPSTPSSEEMSFSTKRNTVKDLILNFESQHQLEPTSLHMPTVVKKRLTIASSWPLAEESDAAQSPISSPNGDGETMEEKKKFKVQLSRTLTEIRKNYVRRVCSTLKKKKEVDESAHLFNCCLLVGLNVATLTPYIKNKFPPDSRNVSSTEYLCDRGKGGSETSQIISPQLSRKEQDFNWVYESEYEVPPWIEHLCFPDASEWSSNRNSNLPNINSQDCQCYCLVITNEKGDRKFGYCRRVVAEETSVCLPLTYCIISSFRATGFYNKVLHELESRHGLPFGLQEAFVKELYNSKFPQPGDSIKVSCLLRSFVVDSCQEMLENNQVTSGENVECVKRIIDMKGLKQSRSSDDLTNSDLGVIHYRQDKNSDFKVPKNTYGHNSDRKSNGQSVYNSNDNLATVRPRPVRICNTRSSEPQFKRLAQLFTDIHIEEPSDSEIKVLNPVSNHSNSSINNNNRSSDINQAFPLLNLPNSQLLHDCLLGDVVLKRPYDSRLEDVDLTILFNTLDLVTLLQTFGSLLHERKVVFISNCLSKLSFCIEALQSILYPFSWQHTFIPVLSSNMLDILSAPLPLIAGVLSSHITETLTIEDGIAVNLDTSTIICYMGDESDIIPKRLHKGLIVALELVTEATQSDDRTRNVLVSEAFVRMFVEACGSYKQFMTSKEDGQKHFERDSFIKHHHSKCVKLFLEWFTETAMFNNFICTRLTGEPSETMFEQRCGEVNCEKNTAALLKNSKVTQKMKLLRQKIFY